MRDESEAKEITHMARSAIKSKANMEAEGIQIIRDGGKARKNFKAEVKKNGKGETKTLGLSAAEGIERAREGEEAKMRGA